MNKKTFAFIAVMTLGLVILIAFVVSAGLDLREQPAASAGAQIYFEENVEMDKKEKVFQLNLPFVKVEVGSEGVKVEAPFTKVDVGKDGVSVDAPFTSVDVGKDGVKVDAPGTAVDVKKDGVSVKAPGTDVNTNR